MEEKIKQLTGVSDPSLIPAWQQTEGALPPIVTSWPGAQVDVYLCTAWGSYIEPSAPPTGDPNDYCLISIPQD